MTDPGRLATIISSHLSRRPLVNFLLVAMLVLNWFLMNHHYFLAQSP